MLYVNFSVNYLISAPIWPISYFQPILSVIFVTIATVKVTIIRDFYTLAFALINLQEELGETLFIFEPHRGGGGQKSP